MNLKLSLLFSVTLVLALLHASNSQVTDHMEDEQTDITDEVGNQRSVSSTQNISIDKMDTTKVTDTSVENSSNGLSAHESTRGTASISRATQLQVEKDPVSLPSQHVESKDYSDGLESLTNHTDRLKTTTSTTTGAKSHEMDTASEDEQVGDDWDIDSDWTEDHFIPESMGNMMNDPLEYFPNLFGEEIEDDILTDIIYESVEDNIPDKVEQQESIQPTERELMLVEIRTKLSNEDLLDKAYKIAKAVKFTKLSTEEVEEMYQTASKEIFDRHSHILLSTNMKSENAAIESVVKSLKENTSRIIEEFESPEAKDKFENYLQALAKYAIATAFQYPRLFSKTQLLQDTAARLYRANRSYFGGREIPEEQAIEECLQQLEDRVKSLISEESWILEPYLSGLEKLVTILTRPSVPMADEKELPLICEYGISRIYEGFEFVFDMLGRSRQDVINEDGRKLQLRIQEFWDEQKQKLSSQEEDQEDRLQK